MGAADLGNKQSEKTFSSVIDRTNRELTCTEIRVVMILHRAPEDFFDSLTLDTYLKS
jgi:hypothetical protein